MTTIGSSPDEERTDPGSRLLFEGRRRFLEELGKHLKRIEMVLQLEADDGEAAFRFYNLLHTVKGSAPVFGLHRLGQAAVALLPHWEWALETKENSGDSVGAPHREWVEEARTALQQLTMEREICLEELKWDEQSFKGLSSSNQARGSRILLIDDDEVLRDYLSRRLSMAGYEVEEAGGVEEAMTRLRQQVFDLIVLDLMMQPMSGYGLFEQMKEDPTLKWIPLVVVSARNDVNDKVRCFHLGADDYVTKPFHYEELEARIGSIITRTKTYEQMAFRDPLTGISNRRFFDHQLDLEFQRLSRYPSPMSIVFLDIDRFKRINDTYGHATGDLVLQGLAHMLQQHLRSTDLLARFGGEEFVAAMPGADAAQAKTAMEDILELMRTAPVAVQDGNVFHITFSAGICEWTPDITKEEWISRADSAMYEAKQSGRNQICVYQGGQNAKPLEPAAPGSVKRLLIADDDPILRSMLVSKFRRPMLEVLEADNGEEALRLIRHWQPHAVIIDGLMPKLNGLEVLEVIRSERKGTGMKVLMLSGKGKRRDVLQGLQSGADDYMVKPFSLLELELRVKRLLEN